MGNSSYGNLGGGPIDVGPLESILLKKERNQGGEEVGSGGISPLSSHLIFSPFLVIIDERRSMFLGRYGQ
jgi:hypothetical protein